MQVKFIDGFIARCEAKGVERDVSLFMLPPDEVSIGDYVVVHVGYAIQTISEQEARDQVSRLGLRAGLLPREAMSRPGAVPRDGSPEDLFNAAYQVITP